MTDKGVKFSTLTFFANDFFKHNKYKFAMNNIQNNDFKLTLSNGILTRYVEATKHFFIKHKAYAFDESEVEKYRGKFDLLRIITTTGRVYEITANSFFEYIYLNSDYGKKQYFIEIKYLKLVETKYKNVRLTHDEFLKVKLISKSSKKKIIDVVSEAIKKL